MNQPEILFVPSVEYPTMLVYRDSQVTATVRSGLRLQLINDGKTVELVTHPAGKLIRQLGSPVELTMSANLADDAVHPDSKQVDSQQPLWLLRKG